ncbi:MAG: NAD(P)-dependent oxidoreductase [Burkholderiaceae bacterium]|nr:NAD(P)-dependent oxidoreductase [Burkholderiaceae bacterium]
MNRLHVALIGVGLMGFPMGKRLCDAGFRVTAYNRTREKAERLRAHGAEVADEPRIAVGEADFVLTMLEQGEAVQEVLFVQGAAKAMTRGSMVIDMSSIKPAEAQDHAASLQALGVSHLDAPVSGGTLGAEAGSLAIMVGGNALDFERARPVLEALGRPTHVGPHGAGQFAKLANQMIVGITIGAVAEALLLAHRGGADIGRVREAIRGGFAESRVLEVHGARMVERDFAARATVNVQVKDLRNALHTAGQLGFDTPITSELTRLYESATASGWGDLDHSALFLALEAGRSHEVARAGAKQYDR